jgi:hypothetical protein
LRRPKLSAIKASSAPEEEEDKVNKMPESCTNRESPTCGVRKVSGVCWSEMETDRMFDTSETTGSLYRSPLCSYIGATDNSLSLTLTNTESGFMDLLDCDPNISYGTKAAE